jgi:hypothetical protein
VTALLIRVGADRSTGGGSWNGPVDSGTGEFAYVAIPETRPVYAGLEKPYRALTPTLTKFGVKLPEHLVSRHMHLDPDFEHLTYGDQGTRAHQLRTNLQVGDFILFYASLIDTRLTGILIYALIGLFIIEEFLAAADVPPSQRDLNAHSRRVLQTNATDLIVCGRQASSGRFKQCLPIGEYRDGAYRVTRSTGGVGRTIRKERLYTTQRKITAAS